MDKTDMIFLISTIYVIITVAAFPFLITSNARLSKKLKKNIQTDERGLEILRMYNEMKEEKKEIIYKLAIEIATPKQQLNSIYDNLPESKKEQLMNYAKDLNNTPEDVNL